MQVCGRLRSIYLVKGSYKVKLLVVDDDEPLVEIQKEVLEAYGYDVSVAYSGNQALSFLENQSVDLILSDIRMPDGDAIYLLDKLQEQVGPPVVIINTGYSDLPHEQILEKGALAIFRKPVDYDVLVNAINEHFDAKSKNLAIKRS